MQERQIHRNVPQLRSAIVDAPVEYLVAGRATGKSEGVLADKSSRRTAEMPRATFGLVAATYQQLLTRTLPPLIKGWEDNGYVNGLHFLIGQKPTEKWKKLWKYPGAFRPVQKFEHTISWYNGFSFQMISQDRTGTSNGMSLDGVMGDEAKLLNRDRIHQETFPANRGLVHAFADNPHHHGITFTTDMPVGTAGRWILEKENNSDPERVKQIVQLQILRMQLGTKASTAQLQQIDQALAVLRRGLTYYHQASTLDNLHALGIQYIRDMMRELSAFEFMTSILNRRPMNLEDGFYPDLDEDKHGYFAYDYHHFENTGYDFKKLRELDGAGVDADYNPMMPMHIALDNNRRIVPMVVAQVHPRKEIRRINSFYSLYPQKLDSTVNAFCTYYRHHLRKTVFLWHDQTAIAEYGHAGSSKDEVVKYLRMNGWTVIERYIGEASGHERRYAMWGHLLKEDGTYPYVWRINRERNKYPLLSMFQAAAIKTKRGFGKDKKPELDPKFPSEEATHFSEADDMLTWGLLESGLPFIQEEATSPGFEMIG